MKKYISPVAKEIRLDAGSLMVGSVPVTEEEVDTQMTKHQSGSSLWDNWND